MLGTILASIPQPYIGYWSDLVGIRRMLILVVVLFSLACIFIAQVNSLVMLTLAFFFLRMFGQGALELLSTNMLPMWFRERLGRVSGIKNVVVRLLIGSVPLGVLAVIKQVGWRGTYMLAGAVVLGVMLPLALFIYIGRPEDIDLLLDIGKNISPGTYPVASFGNVGLEAVPFPPKQTTICPLGPSSVAPITSAVRRFRSEFEAKVSATASPNDEFRPGDETSHQADGVKA